MNSARALTREWLRHPTLYYSTIATCVGGGYECVIIMCVISEYVEYGYACFSGSWQVGEAKIQPVVQLYLCKSYSVLTACIASSLQNQANPVFSKLTLATRTQDSGSTISPGSSTRREHFFADTGSLRRLSMG